MEGVGERRDGKSSCISDLSCVGDGACGDVGWVRDAGATEA